MRNMCERIAQSIQHAINDEEKNCYAQIWMKKSWAEKKYFLLLNSVKIDRLVDFVSVSRRRKKTLQCGSVRIIQYK